MFERLIGNTSAKELLKNSITSGRIGHAYIFEGQKGTGKTELAKLFAAQLLKTQNPDGHPDFVMVTNSLYDPSKKQKNVLVDTIRSMKKDIYIRPYMAERKVYVIPFADTMQAPAQNSLLKVFEEPPEYCTIILLAENANAFLPTILSRAIQLRLCPLEVSQVAGYLTENKGIEKTRAATLAGMSGGAIGKALEMIDDEAAAGLRRDVIIAFGEMAEGSYRNMYDFIKLLKKNKSECDFIFDVLQGLMTDLMFIKQRLPQNKIINADWEELLKKVSGRLTKKSAFRLNEITTQYRQEISQNVNYPTAVLCMALEYWEEIHDRNSRS